MKRTIARITLALFASSLGSAFFVGDAFAKNSTSLGHGVKCTFVLVKSVNGVNTYKTVCRRNH
ncbi:MAG TPA: hypothetical protein VFV55_09870 [Usitatibacteraceae bacterium]|nr:hypothetical protein [Usitatibacteraceae bacterium]